MEKKESEARVVGFAPIARADARVLVLGTAPSVLSLEKREYYGNPRNAFWRIMAELLGHAAGEDYAARTRMLLDARIALWDVLETADRPGSMDVDIVAATAKANEFARFFAEHPEVRAVFFNGSAARKLWDRNIPPGMVQQTGVTLVTLPSTSPANAARTFEDKAAAWRQVADAAAEAHA